MKIVMAGPSGSGKTTLAKYLAEEFGLTFIEQSAGMVMLPEDKEFMRRNWDYKGDLGQVGVINKSHEHPLFGAQFQEAVLRAREYLLKENDNVSLDRSPLDPMVFWMNQVVHNTTLQHTHHFMEQCCKAIINGGITHIIRVPRLNPEVENDGSRCTNPFFQDKIDKLFDWALEYFINYISKVHGSQGIMSVNFCKVKTWNWTQRTIQVKQFIESTTL